MDTPGPALVFDLDGTLADSLSAALAVYNELADEHGLRPVAPEDVPALRHLDAGKLMKHLGLSKLKAPAVLLQGRRLMRARIADVPLVEGIPGALEALRPRASRFGVLTSNSTENARAFLAARGLEDLFDFVSSSSKLSGKAKNLRSICRTFSIDPRRLTYVGDETRDVKAARKAGCRSAAVTWGFNSPEALAARFPDHLLHRPADLPAALLP